MSDVAVEVPTTKPPGPDAAAGKVKKAKKTKVPSVTADKPAGEETKKAGLSQMSLGSFFSRAPAQITPKAAKVTEKPAEKASEASVDLEENTPAEGEVVLKTPVKEKSSEPVVTISDDSGSDTKVKENTANGGDRHSSHEENLAIVNEDPVKCSAGTPPTAVKAAVAAEASKVTRSPGGGASDDEIMLVDDAPAAPAPAGKAESETPDAGKKAGAKTSKAAEKKAAAAAKAAAPGPKQMTLGFFKGAGGEGTKGQGTLNFTRALNSAATPKKRAERPPHPAGTPLDSSAEVLQVLQFARTFREPLRLPALSLADVEQWLDAPAVQPLSALHKALIRTVVKNGDTPGEERFIDDDTWPEVLRQHLADTHGARCSRVWKALGEDEYAALGREERLQALVLLVDDCLQTKTVRQLVDGSVEAVEELKRQTALDEMQERYKKPEGSSAEKMDAFVDVTVVLDEEDDSGVAKTERQRELAKQKEEEAKAARLAEAIRLREERRLVEEAAKRQQEAARKSKAAARVAALVAHTATVRVPYLAACENRNYFVMDVASPGAERMVVCEQFEEDNSAPSRWSTFATPDEHDSLVQHWSPAFVENEAGMQKRIRAFLPPPVTPADAQEDSEDPVQEDAEAPAPAEEQADGDVPAAGAVTDDEGEKEALPPSDVDAGEDAAMDEAEGAQADGAGADVVLETRKTLLGRAKEVVSDMGEFIPEGMFTDYDRFSAEERPAWLSALAESESVDGVRAALLALKEALNHGKMREGWDAIHAVWVKDLGEARTLAAVLYFARQLQVFVGKMKAKPGKIAAIFTGSDRVTRARAGAGAGGKRKRYSYSSEEGEEEEEEEEEEGSDPGADSDGDYEEEEGQEAQRERRLAAREARRAQQEKRQRARRAAAAAPTRRSTRAAAQRRSEPQSDESSESESGESSPVSRSGQAMRGAGKPSEGERRSTRNTRRRVSSEDSESD